LYKNVIADYLHSADNVIYSEWKVTFAWLPKRTIAGNKVWLRKVYRRRRTLLHDLPQFPVNAMERIQYATLEEIVERSLNGLP
jgi:hypothetical protein